MDTLEALAARLRATQDIRAIVRTMKALSSASIRQYENAADAMKSYEKVVTLGLQAVLRDTGRAGRIGGMGTVAAAQGRALVVVGSDRGLCGRFNDRVAHAAEDALADGQEPGPLLLCVAGLRAAARLQTAGHRADMLFTLPGSAGGLAGTVQRMTIAIDRWAAGEGVGRVDLVYNRRTGAARSAPVQRRLLPFRQADLDRLAHAPWPSRSLPLFRMERGSLFSWLVRQHIFTGLYAALAESLAGEHGARLSAMRRAERNIDDRHGELLSAYRVSRQEAVTRELMDLIAGFEAVRTGGRDAPPA